MDPAWKVDAHHHVWDLSVRPHDWLDDDDLAVIRRDFGFDDLTGPAVEAGVVATVLVQVLASEMETVEFLAAAAAVPLVAAVTGWVDLTAPDVADRITELRARPGGGYLRGIRHELQAERDPGWTARPEVRSGIRAVGEAGLVYELLIRSDQLSAVVDLVRSLDDQLFVLDHCGKPPISSGELEPWASGIRDLAALPNVTGKVSGLVTEAAPDAWAVADLVPYADVVLDAFGPDRLMFGSDWPVCLLAADYPTVMRTAEQLLSSLAEHEVRQVFATTAQRVYGI